MVTGFMKGCYREGLCGGVLDESWENYKGDAMWIRHGRGMEFDINGIE
jgi:hypothetical protein